MALSSGSPPRFPAEQYLECGAGLCVTFVERSEIAVFVDWIGYDDWCIILIRFPFGFAASHPPS